MTVAATLLVSICKMLFVEVSLFPWRRPNHIKDVLLYKESTFVLFYFVYIWLDSLVGGGIFGEIVDFMVISSLAVKGDESEVYFTTELWREHVAYEFID